MGTGVKTQLHKDASNITHTHKRVACWARHQSVDPAPPDQTGAALIHMDRDAKHSSSDEFTPGEARLIGMSLGCPKDPTHLQLILLDKTRTEAQDPVPSPRTHSPAATDRG